MRKTFAAAFAAGLGILGCAGMTWAADEEWPSYNRTLVSDRFSPLTEITPQNAADLRETCEVALGDAGLFQPGPVVVGDTLYVTTNHTVVAVNATNCAVKWRYVYEAQEDESRAVNRGVAYMDGKVFRGTADGRLLAIDATTGKEIWRVKAAKPEEFEYLSAAPIAWNGLVFLGPAGSDKGIRGYMSAFDANTGKEVWRFNTIPMKGEPGYETWHLPESQAHGGGGTWTSYTLDPATGELFVSVANPSPDFIPGVRPGDNLFTNAMVVLDAKTGKLIWYYQLSPHDGFDYDLSATAALYNNKDGKQRIALGSKDGNLYILDRKSHKVLSKTPITTIVTPKTDPTPQGVFACPGAGGGVQWNGPAYNPQTDLVYTGSQDWCMNFISGSSEFEPGLNFLGTDVSFVPKGTKSGWVYAVSNKTGKAAWKYHADSPVLSGMTPTAGGVLLTGDAAGDVLIFNAKDGTLLKKENLGGSMGGGIITYSVAGKQYVATSSGNISRSSVATAGSNKPRLVIMTLGVDAAAQPVKITAYPAGEEDRHFGHDQGKLVFVTFCAACHGPAGVGGNGGPALKSAANRMTVEQLMAWIKNPAPPMPKLGDTMLPSELKSVAKYVSGLK